MLKIIKTPEPDFYKDFKKNTDTLIGNNTTLT